MTPTAPPRWRSVAGAPPDALVHLSSARAIPAPEVIGSPDHLTIRPARIADMRAVEPLVRAFAEANLMLPKPLDQLSRHFREFVVAVDERDRVAACGALRVYTQDLAEICSLAVDLPLQRSGVGRRIVHRLVGDARDLGIRRVFALTLNTEFFGRLGFETVARDEFPLKVWADCRNCPKLHACDEIAVALDLSGPDASNGSGQTTDGLR